MKKIILGLLTIVATLSLAACSGSSNVYTFILDDSFTEYLVMETSADYPPYENIEQDENGDNTVVGIDIELAKAIALNAGKNLKVVHKGFDFLISDIQSGKADMAIAAFTPTPERQEQVDFSDSYYDASDDQVVVVKTENLDAYQSIDDVNLSTVRVGAQTGSLQSYLVQEQAPNATAQYLQDLPTLFSNLNNGQIDALFSEATVANTQIAANFPDLSIAFNVESQYTGNAVAVEKGDTELLALINDTIAELTASGQIQEWVDYYSALYES